LSHRFQEKNMTNGTIDKFGGPFFHAPTNTRLSVVISNTTRKENDMAWSWSHTDEAYAAVREQLNSKAAAANGGEEDASKWLRVVWAEWVASNRKDDQVSTDLDLRKYETPVVRAKRHDGLVEVNPFLGIKLDLRSDQAKRYFVDATDTVAILDACPDQEWRVIVALGRYGGLRCPSEVLGLKWSDINWERDRFLVTAPKTERYGKGERVVPLFDGLREELTALFAQAAPGVKCAADGPVVARYRSSEANLRTTFTKIVKRAGVKPFPKPFMNLRASARTEKERSGRFANHVLNDWFGHRGDIAETYYLQTTEDDFKEAAKPSGVLDLSLEGQLEGQSLREQGAPTTITPKQKPRENGVLRVSDSRGKQQKYTRRVKRSQTYSCTIRNHSKM
jgi:integrase